MKPYSHLFEERKQYEKIFMSPVNDEGYFYETNSNANYYLDDDIKSNFSQIIKTTIYATPKRKPKQNNYRSQRTTTKSN